jgi:hypothetical protein
LNQKYVVIWVVVIVLTSFLGMQVYESKSENMRRVCYAADRIFINPVFRQTLPEAEGLSLFSDQRMKINLEQQQRYERLKRSSSEVITKGYPYLLEDNNEDAERDPNEDIAFAFDEMDEYFEYIKNICDIESRRNVLDWLEESAELTAKLKSLL